MSILHDVATAPPAQTAPPVDVSTAPAARAESGLLRWLFNPIPIAPIVYFRFIFGAVMVWECLKYLLSGAVYDLFMRGQMHFKYIGFEWIDPWPGRGMYIHFAAMSVLAATIALGAFYRVATVIFCFAFSYTFLIDESNYLNHLYLVCLISFLMIFIPAHRAWSLDAWRNPHIRATHVPRWTLLILIFQVGVPYFFGGIAKINLDWLQGEPMRMWMAQENYPIIGRWAGTEPAIWLFSYGGLLLDLFIVPALLWRRTRPFAIAAALLFHLINALIFHIGIFPWLMIGTLPLFFPMSWWRRMNERFVERGGAAVEEAKLVWTSGRRIAAALVGVYVLWQCAIPFRHWLYPGSVHWTEEGHRYSWHMKLRSKYATAKFIVTHPSLPAPIEIDPDDYLTARQEAKMPTHPDMILQFAHWLRDQHRHLAPPDVEVRAEVSASLNSRKHQPLIDPTVNLAAVKRNLWHCYWVVPLYEPLRVEPLPWKPQPGEAIEEDSEE